MRLLMPTLSLVMIGVAVALADPYGPPYAVTDMAPFCATCHASASPAQLQDLPADVAAGETIEGKHFSRIKSDPAYRGLSPADREQLIAAIKWVDETRTTWVLRTPPEPGSYSLAAAFYYGTEKVRPLGTVIRNGRAEPRGGPGGASGRIMFSDVIKISVK